MGKPVEKTIDRFDGGIESDPRDPRENTCQVVSNFDVITNPRKMTPYRSSESGDSSGSTNRIQNFTVALQSGTTYRLFGLGRDGSDNALIFNKTLLTSGSDNMADATWAQNANNTSSSGTMQSPRDFRFFVYYRRTGYLYGAINGTAIWRCDPDGGDAFVNSTQALTYTSIFQGLVHSKDNILYVPYYNNAGGAGAKSFIAKFDGTTWSTTALTLPDHLMPVSICQFGNFLAIGCAPVSAVGNSVVYLWDRDASLTTLHESVDWGSGLLYVLEEVDGELVGISTTSTRRFVSTPSISHRDRVIFRRLVGTRAVKFKEVIAEHSAVNAQSTLLTYAKQRVDNRLYFAMILELNGAVRDGVWSIGRVNPDAPWTLIHERTSNNSTALAADDGIEGFFAAGDYLFITYLASGTYATSKTDNTATFSHNAVYESKRFATGDPTLRKTLVGASVMHEYLPSGASVSLAYRTDQNTSWTTILTSDTANDISREAVNIESTGAALPKDYREIEFRIVATGGNAEVTGFTFKEDIIGRLNYEPVN